ncbi:MAG TPA: type 1 fimbrial protein [Lysobacter sp.]
MKKLLLAAAAVVALAPLSALAADGTITINGQVNANTCRINATGSPNVTVTLPTVSTVALPAANATAGNQAFSLALTLCSPGTQATTYFEPGANVDFANGNLKNTGAATNVQVRLLNSDLSVINLANGVGAQGSQQFTTDTNGAATLSYYAQYFATGAAGAGSVSTSVQYTMIYQ